MRILPVIDLKGGEAVRGVGGRRDEYRKLETRLTQEATPEGIARAFAERLPVGEVYVADLDAIAGGEPDWRSYEAIGRCGLRLWIDAGIGDAAKAGRLAAFDGADVEAIIVGLESVLRVDELPQILATLQSPRAAFSLDLKNGRPLTRIAVWREAPPEEIAEHAASIGFSRLIVLDLAHVGEHRGVGGADVCRRIRRRLPDVEIIGGGGLGNTEDARLLADAGCNSLLIASALHDGRLALADIAAIQSL